MSKKDRAIELFIVDIFVAIEKIKLYTRDFQQADTFRHNSLHWDATIRQLEILGESLNHLLDNERFASLAPEYFRKVVNFRNVIVHEYFGIDEEEVWDIVTQKLDLLHRDMHRIVSHIDMTSAIHSVLEETSDEAIVMMLQQLLVHA